MSLTLYYLVGDIGSGKSLIMTYFAKKYNIPTYADYRIDLPNCHILELDELIKMQYEEVLILLDESDEFMNNRRSMSDLTLFLDYVWKQSRKRKYEVVCSAQLMDVVDWRYIAKCPVTITALGQSKKGFEYLFTVKSIFGDRNHKFTMPMKTAESLFPIYDTYEVINPPDIDNLVFEIQDPKKRLETIERVADLVQNNAIKLGIDTEKRLTEKKLKYILLNLGESEELAYYVISALDKRGFKT